MVTKFNIGDKVKVKIFDNGIPAGSIVTIEKILIKKAENKCHTCMHNRVVGDIYICNNCFNQNKYSEIETKNKKEDIDIFYFATDDNNRTCDYIEEDLEYMSS